MPLAPTGSYRGLWLQMLFALNSIFQGGKEQVDPAELCGDQAASAASSCHTANAFVTIACGSACCIDRSDAETGKRTSRVQGKVMLSPSPRSSSAVRSSGLLIGKQAALDPPRRRLRFPRVRDIQEETVPAAACSQKRTGFCTTSEDEMLGLFVLYRTPGTGLVHPLLILGGFGTTKDILVGTEAPRSRYVNSMWCGGVGTTPAVNWRPKISPGLHPVN